MQSWNEMIHTALLGTDKKTVSTGEIEPALREAAEVIIARKETDKEEQFLQLAAVVLNFRQSGAVALHKEDVSWSVAEPETLRYCPPAALQLLRDILSEENNSLLNCWMRKCAEAGRLVTPEFIPVLLNKTVNQRWLEPAVTAVCGNRGVWMRRWNPSWGAVDPMDEGDLWETGTPEQRKRCLANWRKTDPAKARAMLMQTWSQENANGKAELLKQLDGTVALEDKDWLEGLLSEKSQKVKEEVSNLLAQLPGSTVVEKAWEIVRQAVTLRKEKALLGMVNKTTLEIRFPEKVDESIVASVPPSYLVAHFGATPDAIVGYFKKDKAADKLLTALAGAAVRFRDGEWAQALVKHADRFFPEVLPLLSRQQGESYCLGFMDTSSHLVIQHMREAEGEWSLAMTKAILTHTAKQAYQYNQSFYKDAIDRIPMSVAPDLEKFSPSEVHLKGQWDKNAELVIRLLTLKGQISHVFTE